MLHRGISLSKILPAVHDIYICFWLFSPDTDGFTRQLRIPITTQSDQQQHMELVQWWVESKHTRPLLKDIMLTSDPGHTWHTASVNRPVCTEGDITASPHTEPHPPEGGERRLFWALGLADPWTLQDRLWDPWKCGFYFLPLSQPLLERLNRLKL